MTKLEELQEVLDILYDHTDQNTMTIGEIEFKDIAKEILEKIKP